jgi:hypothetical protein
MPCTEQMASADGFQQPLIRTFHLSNGNPQFRRLQMLRTCSEVNNFAGSEIEILFLSSCSPQIVNFRKYASFQS